MSDDIRRTFTFVVAERDGDRVTISLTIEPPVEMDAPATPAAVCAAAILQRVQEVLDGYSVHDDAGRN